LAGSGHNKPVANLEPCRTLRNFPIRWLDPDLTDY